MSAAAEAVRGEPRVAPRAPRVRGRDRPKRRPHVASGVVWIIVIGVLLVGVVAVNVAVLKLNVDLDKLGRDRARLRADNARLSSSLSSALASARIHALARDELGLVSARAAETTYVDLAPK